MRTDPNEMCQKKLIRENETRVMPDTFFKDVVLNYTIFKQFLISQKISTPKMSSIDFSSRLVLAKNYVKANPRRKIFVKCKVFDHMKVKACVRYFFIKFLFLQQMIARQKP